LSRRFLSPMIARSRARSSDPTMTLTVWAMAGEFHRSGPV
jgi:hypothetical protein